MKKILTCFLAVVLIFSSTVGVFATNADTPLAHVGAHLYAAVQNPQVGSIGGEWVILGLARSNMDIPDAYFENYYQTVCEYLTAHNGILHSKKYTEYSRVILALTAIGKNPADIAGYNLLTPLADYEKTVWQGINGAIWALIALDSGNYAIPENTDAAIQATREMYVQHILERQTSDGGWALTGDVADPDVTGMALQALSGYRADEKVQNAIQKALTCLSLMQKDNGGFASYATENSESSVQVLVALCTLGIDMEDARFIKNGNSVLDNLMTYYEADAGFAHIPSGGTNLMATEQCFYALVALQRARDNKCALYAMQDARSITSSDAVQGLTDKHEDVQKMPMLYPAKTFADIEESTAKAAIEALAARGIINGQTQNEFAPRATMTRVEFATIIVKGLGLPQKSGADFADVTTQDWFYNYVGTAYHYGIIKGVSAHEFNPNGTITREEAAVMVVRAANLCGLDTQVNTAAARDVLAQFTDYVKASDWAQSALAFCYDKDILDDSVMAIQPKEAVTREEIAAMLYGLLSKAALL